MNIFLIGFMGSGKTSVGWRLSQRLGYYFLDMDQQIEKEERCKISQLFKEKGESFFRQLETQLLSRLVSLQNTVVSTGGGIVTTEGNLEIMKRIGKVVYLKLSPEAVYQRLKYDTSRPLLQTENVEEQIRALLEKRESLYAQANSIVGVQDRSVNQITSQIIHSLGSASSVEKL